MSSYSVMETQKLVKATQAAKLAADKAKLTEKNKAAAREQLLRMQIYLARVSTK